MFACLQMPSSGRNKRVPEGQWAVIDGPQRAWLRPGRGRTSARQFAGPGVRVAGISVFRRHCARQRAPLREGGGAQRRGENAARALARVGARLRPGRAQRTQEGRPRGVPCARPRRSAAATFSSRLSSRSLARPAPPFVIRHCGFPMDDSPACPAKPLQTEKVGVGASPGECEE